MYFLSLSNRAHVWISMWNFGRIYHQLYVRMVVKTPNHHITKKLPSFSSLNRGHPNDLAAFLQLFSVPIASDRQRCGFAVPLTDPRKLNRKARTMGVNPKIGGFYPPNHPLKNRVIFTIIFTIHFGVPPFLETSICCQGWFTRDSQGHGTPENSKWDPSYNSHIIPISLGILMGVGLGNSMGPKGSHLLGRSWKSHWCWWEKSGQPVEVGSLSH